MKSLKGFPFLLAIAMLPFFRSSVIAQTMWSAKVSPELRVRFDAGENVDVLLIFAEKADLSRAASLYGKAARGQYVFEQLQVVASRSQANAIRILRAANANINSLYLVNAIAVQGLTPELAEELTHLPELSYISPDPWVYLDMPEPEAAVAQRSTIEWGVDRIGAPLLWAQGYTGQGITVGGADTGYDWLHPAIEKHYRGWDDATQTADHNYNWHDGIHELSPLGDTTSQNPCGINIVAPCDDHSHGTHTMGTMTGDDDMGNQIGVAPGAKWVGCRNMERGWGRPSSYLECFQWFLAPTDLDNANPDPSKAPHVINNSWYCSYEEGCTDLGVDELLHQAVINLKASGVVVVVSNGNSGPSCSSAASPPAYFEESFSIGAFASNDTISGFSSRGPVLVDGSMRIKPNVSAPGQNVRSSVLFGGYANYSGTSMAGPHAVGMVALILSARPELAGYVDDIEDIVEQSAIPTDGLFDCSDLTGTAHPNNTYGYGRISATAALALAEQWSPPTGVQNLYPTPLVLVYPNPVIDQVRFDIHNGSSLQSLRITDVDGKTVLFQDLNIQETHHIIQIRLDGLPAGIYLYQIQGIGSSISGKIFIN